MDKLLDKEVHQLYKAPSLATYLSSKPTSHHPVVTTTCQGQSAVFCQTNVNRQEPPSIQFIPKAPVTPLERSPAPSDDTSTLECSQESSPDWPDQSPQRLDYLNLEHTGPGTQLNTTSTTCSPRPKLNYRHSRWGTLLEAVLVRSNETRARVIFMNPNWIASIMSCVTSIRGTPGTRENTIFWIHIITINQ